VDLLAGLGKGLIRVYWASKNLNFFYISFFDHFGSVLKSCKDTYMPAHLDSYFVPIAALSKVL
jgi:hypothetical protein